MSLWDAVDKLVAPSRVKLERQQAGEWLTELAGQTDGYCDLPSYKSATVVWATVPSLWDQSSLALYGSEAANGRGSKPLRERSVADLNLIEIRNQVIEAIRWETELIAGEVISGEFKTTEVRHLASLIGSKKPDATDLWASKLTSWANALETYLNAGEHEAKPVRIRDSACPTCKTAQVTIDWKGHVAPFNIDEDHHDGDRQVVAALVVRFRDGLVQAAVCEACGDSWFRGDDLEWLARTLGIHGLDTPSAEVAC